jgi:starvation-inducible DNA-binding protein
MESPIHKTQADLPEEIRSKAIDLLNHHLATMIDLKLQSKHAHWNVKGSNFNSLHELFDEVAAQAESASNQIAGRIGAIGGSPDGTARAVAVLSLLPEYPSGITSGIKHVQAMTAALATTGKLAHRAGESALAFGDPATGDLFTQILGPMFMLLRKLEAHLGSQE